MAIVWLGQRECGERATVGGKAAHLSLLTEYFRVPPGFCLVRDDPGPPELTGAHRRELAAAYGQLSTQLGADDPPVAVRSSAVDEDGAEASFAGQHETFLNVRGADAVADAVVECWKSGLSERVLEYRRSRGLDAGAGLLPVLVQSLVLADVSAVVFSANPVTGNRGEIVINAGWGLGESIVAGSVNPDGWTVGREDLGIERVEIQKKRRMTVAVPGGTEEVEVPWSLQEAPALDDEAVVAMARLAIDLEERFGWPVDIECCWAGGELYLLQCRAITSLDEADERSDAWVLSSER